MVTTACADSTWEHGLLDVAWCGPSFLRRQNRIYGFVLREMGRTADHRQVLNNKFGKKLRKVGDTRLELVTSAV